MIFFKCLIVFFLFSFKWNFFLIFSIVLFGFSLMLGMFVLIIKLNKFRIKLLFFFSVLYVKK